MGSERGHIPITEWETPSGKNLTTEGFGSRRTKEKGPFACLR